MGDAGCAGDAAPCYSRGNGGGCATYSTPQWTIPLTCYEKFPGFNVCMKTGNCNGHSDFTCKVIGGNSPMPVPTSPPAPSPSSPPSPASQPSGCSGGDGAPCYVNGCGGCNGGLSCHKKSGAWNACLPDSWPCKEHL